jgi:hypothetical protein
MVDQMETLQSLFAQSEMRRGATEDRLLDLTTAVEGLTGRLGPGPVAATERLAAAQERLTDVLEEGQRSSGIDEESRMRLRSIDVQLLKIYEDLGAARRPPRRRPRPRKREAGNNLRWPFSAAAATVCPGPYGPASWMRSLRC